jgi:MFS family permease
MKHQSATTLDRPRLREKSRHVLHGILLVLPALLAGVLMTTNVSGFGMIIFNSIADAYIQVSTFVAATLLIVYGIEKFFNLDVAAALRRDTFWQVPVAAALGALPGCGGAIIVVTQYVTGRLTFGSVVAVLTSTMGDAAFLLIAQEPLTGLAIISMGFFVGTLSGWITNAIHGGDFLRGGIAKEVEHNKDASARWIDHLWLIMMMPGIVLAVLVAFQLDADAFLANPLFDRPATFLGVVGGVLALSMRLAPRFGLLGDKTFSKNNTIVRRTIADTNFVTTWVVAAFLLFELSVYFFGLNLKNLFTGVELYTPLMAVLVGFIPGCGPQVLVTTMYLSGIVPISALIGNAISNDGDALFPAIAIAPRVALIATLYSAVPALLISYGWLFLFERP